MNATSLLSRFNPAVILSTMQTLVPERKAEATFGGGVLVLKVIHNMVVTFDALCVGGPPDPLVKAAVATEKIERIFSRRQIEAYADEWLASQSAEPDIGVCGGGVFVSLDRTIVGAGFCGGPAVLDESLVVGLMLKASLPMPGGFKNQWYARTLECLEPVMVS